MILKCSDLVINEGSVLLRAIAVSLKIILKVEVLKDHGEMTGLLIEISSSDLSVDSRSNAMHLCVKKLHKNFIMSFHANNITLATCHQ